MDHGRRFGHFKSRWGLEGDREPIHTAGSAIYHVAYKGCPAVLKIFKHDSDEGLSARALHHFGGAVRVLKEDEHAVLVRRAVPGNQLKELSLQGNDSEATKVFCDVCKRLHNQASTPDGFPTVSDWGKAFDAYLASRDTRVSKTLVVGAKTTFHELARSQGEQVLLHGDLHHDNILWDEHDGWLAIDPKGVVGEREIEASAFFKNPVGHSEIYLDDEVIAGRIGMLCKILGLDRDRMLKWCFSLTVLSCIWLTEIDEKPDDWLNLAEKLERMISADTI